MLKVAFDALKNLKLEVTANLNDIAFFEQPNIFASMKRETETASAKKHGKQSGQITAATLQNRPT